MRLAHEKTTKKSASDTIKIWKGSRPYNTLSNEDIKTVIYLQSELKKYSRISKAYKILASDRTVFSSCSSRSNANQNFQKASGFITLIESAIKNILGIDLDKRRWGCDSFVNSYSASIFKSAKCEIGNAIRYADTIGNALLKEQAQLEQAKAKEPAKQITVQEVLLNIIDRLEKIEKNLETQKSK